MLAVCGIVRKNGRILMCKRSAGGQFPGYWELPTECLEGEETLEDALERVFFERLTVNLRQKRPWGAVDCGLFKSDANDEDVRLLGYEVELAKNFIYIYGYDDFRWVKLSTLKRMRVLEPYVTIIIRCM
jgi:8-oxo-dGTP diphosphatase